MAKGIPLMGRDPDGKAKMINVDENGNVKVLQSGTIVAVDNTGTVVATSIKEYRGLSTGQKPNTDVPLYSTYLEMDTAATYYYDGVDWRVF